jgi:hypothetical protein
MIPRQNSLGFVDWIVNDVLALHGDAAYTNCKPRPGFSAIVFTGGGRLCGAVLFGWRSFSDAT